MAAMEKVVGRNKAAPQRQVPATGWAQVDSITAGRWARFHPQEVRIIAERFMKKDPAGVSHWFDLEEGQTIDGLLARSGGST